MVTAKSAESSGQSSRVPLVYNTQLATKMYREIPLQIHDLRVFIQILALHLLVLFVRIPDVLRGALMGVERVHGGS